MKGEFPVNAADWPNELSRRRFVQLMGASIALGGATGCTRNPPEHIVPYVNQPEEIIPGKPLYFATALTLGGFARGVLVETHEGRPTKIEGNSQHPASLGASDVFMQSELLTLFDPDRSQALTNNGQISTWEAFLGELAMASQRWKLNSGADLRLLTRRETSPTFLDQIRRLLAKYPAAKWHEYEPLGTDPSHAIYHFDKAEVIVSLGADFLNSGPASLKYAREFAGARRPNGKMNRLYVAESTPTLTGAMADHRLIMAPNQLEQFARELQNNSASKIASIVAHDLRAHAGRSVVLAGEFEARAIHDAVRQLNELLGNIGRTVDYIPPTAGGRDLRELVEDMHSGAVKTLIIISGNPAYDAPADCGFAQSLRKIARTVHLDLYANETATLCQWHIPEAHALESWSDARAFDGTASIMQPVIEPLFGGRSRYELLSSLLDEAPATGYDIVRSFWQTQPPAPDFERVWRKSLHDGVAYFQLGSASSRAVASTMPGVSPSASADGLYLLIRPSAQTFDGRFSNNAWLQEFPDPLTTIVWDNVALVSTATALRLQLANGDIVKLKFHGREVRAPIWILPGQADDCFTIHLGYGRTRAGRVGNGVGFNAYALAHIRRDVGRHKSGD